MAHGRYLSAEEKKARRRGYPIAGLIVVALLVLLDPASLTRPGALIAFATILLVGVLAPRATGPVNPVQGAFMRAMTDPVHGARNRAAFFRYQPLFSKSRAPREDTCPKCRTPGAMISFTGHHVRCPNPDCVYFDAALTATGIARGR